jgi:hypothetical protein
MRLNNKRDGFLIAGIVLFAIAIIGTFVIPYFFLITPIFLLVAILFVWLSKRKTSTKILWSVSPIGLLFLLLVIGYQPGKKEFETFLIPQDFRGKFVIFFEETCGTDVKYVGGRRIYEIPNDGVLTTKFKREAGYIADEFYLVDNQGGKVLLPELDTRDFNFNGRLTKTDNEPPRDKLAVFRTNFDTVLGKTYAYTVSTYQEVEDNFSDNKHYIEFKDKAEKKLRECRGQ